MANRTQFQPNNKAAANNRGPARKLQHRRGRAALIAVLDHTDRDGKNNWHVFWESQFGFAVNGDYRAARLVAEFALGAPQQCFEVTTPAPPPMITDKMSLAEAMRAYQLTRKRDYDGAVDDESIH